MRPTVLLWDIDGTLISTAGAGRRAVERAFEARYGSAEAAKFPYDGMTDRAIARKGLLALRPDWTDAALEAEMEALLATYLEKLADETSRADSFRVHAGVLEALDQAARRPGFALGLGTGNLQEGARLKLEPVRLYHRFAFGGFGSDHIERPALIRIGAERGAAQLGRSLDACRVVVIGDTPKDVAAAQAMGAECLAVATGRYDVASLRASGATHACETLADAAALRALLGDDQS